jgi:hypothetical protein
MVRYADDFVILIKEGLEDVILESVKDWLEKVGLKLNLGKTKLTKTRKKGKVGTPDKTPQITQCFNNQ